MGFFGKLWKLILGVLLALKKLVIVVFVAIAGFFKKMFGKGDGDSGEKKKSTSGSSSGGKSGGSQIGVPIKRVVAVPQDLPRKSPTAEEAQLPLSKSLPPTPTRGGGGAGGGTQGPLGPMGT